MGWDIHQTWVGARGLMFVIARSKGSDSTEHSDLDIMCCLFVSVTS